MRWLLGFGLALATGMSAAAQTQSCADDPRRSGLARTIAFDSEGGPTLGRLNFANTLPLKRGEVVLTFDDGPLPTHTRSVLETLERHCVKGIFFAVGRMAWSNQATIRDIARRGHTIATHTWSHPGRVPDLSPNEARLEIEKGFAAVTEAVGAPIAPFFRYPGLNWSSEVNAYLASRNISVWSVDVVSGDTTGVAPGQLVEDTIARIQQMGKGIVLFHDIRSNTAEALDPFLVRLREIGFKVVHVVSTTAFRPDEAVVAQIDFNKTIPRSISFTGVDPVGLHGLNAIKTTPVVASGTVDMMRTEWIDLESGPRLPSARSGERAISGWRTEQDARSAVELRPASPAGQGPRTTR